MIHSWLNLWLQIPQIQKVQFNHSVRPTLCNPMDCSPPGSSVHEIFQARILEWVAIPSPGDLPNPGIEPGSPALQANSLPTELQGRLLLLLLSHFSCVQLCVTP